MVLEWQSCRQRPTKDRRPETEDRMNRPETGDGGPGKQLGHTQDGIVGIGRLPCLLSRDDLVADVDAALSGDLQIPLGNVP